MLLVVAWFAVLCGMIALSPWAVRELGRPHA